MLNIRLAVYAPARAGRMIYGFIGGIPDGAEFAAKSLTGEQQSYYINT
jgi:hypothetical protein